MKKLYYQFQKQGENEKVGKEFREDNLSKLTIKSRKSNFERMTYLN